MSNIKTKELSKIGYTNDQARSLVINIVSKHFKHTGKAELVKLLMAIKGRSGQLSFPRNTGEDSRYLYG